MYCGAGPPRRRYLECDRASLWMVNRKRRECYMKARRSLARVSVVGF